MHKDRNMRHLASNALRAMHAEGARNYFGAYASYQRGAATAYANAAQDGVTWTQVMRILKRWHHRYLAQKG